MQQRKDIQSASTPPRKYKWPWFILGGLLLAIALAALWMSREVARMRLIRELNSPSSSPGTATMSPASTGTVSRADTSTNGMVWIPPGKFWMGDDEGQTDEQPTHELAMHGFWMDKT